MAFALNKVVPWGRSYEEYVAMFSLSDCDLRGRILGCGDGPASFNSRMTQQGGRVVSVDPIYAFTTEEIRHRINETYDVVLEQTRRNQHEFIWRNIRSVEELGEVRKEAMEEFLRDYPAGLRERRYVVGSLPRLPFADGAFDLVVCSHLLFLYSEILSQDFHIQSIHEMCRVAGEVRVFPLLELGATSSRHLENVVALLREERFFVEVVAVPYEFQKGGNRMLRVTGSTVRR